MFCLPPHVSQRPGTDERLRKGEEKHWKGKSQVTHCSRIIHGSPLGPEDPHCRELTESLRRGEAGRSGTCHPQCGELTARAPLALPHSPQDVVHTHDALGLQVAWVVDDCPLRLQPHVAPMLRQHPVLAAHHLALGTHYGRRRNLRSGRWGAEDPTGGQSLGKWTGLGTRP